MYACLISVIISSGAHAKKINFFEKHIQSKLGFRAKLKKINIQNCSFKYVQYVSAEEKQTLTNSMAETNPT